MIFYLILGIVLRTEIVIIMKLGINKACTSDIKEFKTRHRMEHE